MQKYVCCYHDAKGHLVGGEEREKDIGHTEWENHVGLKYQLEKEPSSFTEGRTIVHLGQCCKVLKAV